MRTVQRMRMVIHHDVNVIVRGGGGEGRRRDEEEGCHACHPDKTNLCTHVHNQAIYICVYIRPRYV